MKYVKLVNDPYPPDPRKDFDNLGVMVCRHRRYKLGDVQPEESPETWKESLTVAGQEDVCVRLPLYLYDHSGLTMACTPFLCPWDSGQVGWIYCTWEKARGEYGDRPDEDIIASVVRCLKAEVKVYDQYLTGDVYGIEVYSDPECENLEDSCWGYFGTPTNEDFRELAGGEYTRVFGES